MFSQPCNDPVDIPDPGVEAVRQYQREAEIAGHADYVVRKKQGDALAEQKLAELAEQTRKVVTFKLSTVREKPTHWVWQDRIPFGEITLIAGKGGVGKSTLLAYLGAQITTGKCPGDLDGTPVDIMYVASEDDLSRTVKPRFVAAGGDLDRIHMVIMERDEMGRLDMSRDCPRIAEEAQRVGARVIMFDPLSSSLGSGRKNDQDDMRKVFETIQKMATENNLAVVGLAHTRKGASGDLLESIMGSSEQGNVCRSAMGVARDPENNSRCILSQEKSNLSAAHNLDSYSFAFEQVEYEVDGTVIRTSSLMDIQVSEISVGDVITEAGDNGKASQAREWLREHLMKNGQAMKKDVLEAGKKLHHAPRTLERAASMMCHVTRQNGNGPAVWELKP